jgi:preprotein translocase subunit YajC
VKGSSLIFLIIVVIAVYALMILPQRKQQKQKAEMMRKLVPGSKVLTASGIFAEVMEIRDTAIVMQIADNVEVEMDPRSVVRVVGEAGRPAAAKVDEAETDVEEENTNE